jgi:hypothetical protein
MLFLVIYYLNRYMQKISKESLIAMSLMSSRLSLWCILMCAKGSGSVNQASIKFAGTQARLLFIF